MAFNFLEKKMRKITGILAGLAILMAVGIAMTGCQRTSYREYGGMVWNTTYHIIFEGPEELQDSIMMTLKDVEQSVSVFNDSSTVAKVNSQKETKVDRHFITIYNLSRKINKESGGVFDPTLAPLIEAWGFGKAHHPTADTLHIDSLLEIVGIGKTRLKNEILKKNNENITFNFSAIAKGYGVDCVADMLEKAGVENYLIEIGGEIRCLGHNSRGQDWLISIDTPSETDQNLAHESLIKISATDAGIATSGNYRNYYETDHGRYGHTISPFTGRPVKTDVLSATVICSTAMEADALATSCMALGSEKALQLCDSLGCGVMLVGDSLRVMSNQIFDSYVKRGI